MLEFSINLKFKVPASAVYEAIASTDGPRHWWTKFAKCTDRIGKVSHFPFPKAGFFADMLIVKLIPNELIEWECVDSMHPVESGWADLKDWVGTKLRFEISAKGNGACTLDFSHVGLTPDLGCYEACNSAWHYYLNESLRTYIETGHGMPYKEDSEDNIKRI